MFTFSMFFFNLYLDVCSNVLTCNDGCSLVIAKKEM